MQPKRTKTGNSIKSSRKTKMLLLFICLSFLFWILIKFSKEYTDTIPLHVDYVNLPKGKMLQDNSKKQLNLTVKTYGFDLFKAHIFKKNIVVDLKGIKRKKGQLYFQLSKNLMPQIKSQLASDIQLLAVQPDTLFFELSSSKTKNVKVVADVSMQYESGYSLLGDLTIEPTEVTISGPEKYIDSIKEVSTQHWSTSNVDKSFSHKLGLVEVSQELNITYSDVKVRVSGNVEKVTESSLSLEFEIQNPPDNYTITTIPEKVEVIFQVGLSDFNKINKDDFKVICDYKRSSDNDLNYLIPELISKPSIASQIKIVPNKIEYLIKQ